MLTRAQKITVDKAGKQNKTFVARGLMKDQPEYTSIQYKRLAKDIARIKERLGKRRMSAKGVGEHTFDYFLAKECE